jgi:hypothetical protein
MFGLKCWEADCRGISICKKELHSIGCKISGLFIIKKKKQSSGLFTHPGAAFINLQRQANQLVLLE